MSLLVCWGKGGELVQPWGDKWGLPWGSLCGTSGGRKLCMVPCHSCHIYGIWRSKEVRKALKSSFRVAMQAIRGTISMGKRSFHYVSLLYWNFILSLPGYCKLFYRILTLFLIYMLFYLFCIYWDWQSQKCHPCDTNTFTHSLIRIHLLQLKIHNIWMKFFWNQKVFHSAIKEISTQKSLYKSFLIRLSAD